ncbi:uncharacterized protein LOC143209450 isoform X2 [Lasioglossum baleicum]
METEKTEKKKPPSVPFIDICAYVECSNNRHQVSLYCFPKKGNPLCDEWLSRVCNPALKHYSSSTLRRMGVCEKHFTPESFKPGPRSYPYGRKKLKRNAIPEPSDHLVEMWKQKLKDFMAGRLKKRDPNIEEKEKTKEGKGREEEEQQQHQQEKRKEEQQQQRKKLGIEEQQQRRKEPGKEEQQQQRKETGKEEQQQQWKEPVKEEQQQQWKESGKEEQQQQRKKPEVEEQQQPRQETEKEQQQETGGEEWQETRPVVEEQEIEIEMHVNKPTRVYTKQPFSFSDDEDDGMEWAEDEPVPNYVALDESSPKKSPSEMKLERENVKLKTENKYLKIQLKYLKQRLQRSLISRDRLSNELRKISK